MDFREPAAVDTFRAELRRWLEANLDERFRDLGYDPDAGEAWLATAREWNARLADAGWAAVAWPVEYGGRGAGLLEQVAWAEEIHRAGAPPLLNPIGIANIAPSIMQWGTEEQKRRFLPPMQRGDDIWCQGFSEPDAGSDLAALRATAVRDGDHYVVTGQKVWNTFGHIADWCELLVRSDPDAPRHKGISCLLVDMRLPGVEVRPLVTITGEREFNEIFFDEVRVPVTALLGAEHDGWRVAMTTLTHERGGVASLHLGLRAKVGRLLDLAQRVEIDGRPAAAHPGMRRRLARAYVHAEHLKALADRAVSGALHGRPTGPESSLAKLVWSELDQDLAEVSAELLGPDAIATDDGWARDRLYARALTIAGGTTQVNKNIVAQRVLGLPRA